jgi:hypothetical protein
MIVTTISLSASLRSRRADHQPNDGSSECYSLEEVKRYILYLICRGDEAYGGFIWALYRLNNNQTRLVSRARLSYSWNKPTQLAFDL